MNVYRRSKEHPNRLFRQQKKYIIILSYRRRVRPINNLIFRNNLHLVSQDHYENLSVVNCVLFMPRDSLYLPNLIFTDFLW